MLLLAANESVPDIVVAFTLLVLVLTAAGFAAGRAMTLKKRPPAPGPQPHPDAMRAHFERESKAFDQHTEINGIAVQKMKREVELLDIQLQLAKFDMGMRHDSRDYHDLMAEKARLEIESLKQHIKEQQKRNDEFGEH